MKLSDFEFNDHNHFVAMEYYALIFNRTFLALITNERLIGIKVNGLVGVEAGDNFLSLAASSRFAIKGDLNNPYSYIKSKYLNKVQDVNLTDDSLLKSDKSNFIIERQAIRQAYHNPSKKWGMGYYPHDGKVYVETHGGTKREFIILGSQSGTQIAKAISLY